MMNIAWLWYYTNSTNPDLLQKSNEDRAFAVYSRWRSMLRWVSSLHDGWCRSREQRAGTRELLEMSDHLLRDVGLLRSGTELQLANSYEPYRSDRLTSLAWPMSSEIPGHCRIVPCNELAGPDIPEYVVPEQPSRAA